MEKTSIKEFVVKNKKVFIIIGVTAGVVGTAVAIKYGLAHKAAKLALDEGSEIIATVSEEII